MTRWAPPVCALLMAACTFANELNLKHADRLEIGKLQESEFEELFGEEHEKSRRTTPNGRFLHARYGEPKQNISGDCYRLLWLEFRNGLLNAFMLASSCEGDRTNAQVDAATGLMSGVGVMTKDDVRQRMGEPTARAICPSLLGRYEQKCNKGTEVWQWMTSSEQGFVGDRHGEAGTYVVFDAAGTLADVDIIEP